VPLDGVVMARFGTLCAEQHSRTHAVSAARSDALMSRLQSTHIGPADEHADMRGAA
jgi:hypothetical protein